MNQAQPLKQEKKARFGLIKVRIDSHHVLKSPDGRQRQFRVLDKRRYPKAKLTCVCLYCKKSWQDEETLLAEHPETYEMEKNEETHIYAFWSDDPLEPSSNEDKKIAAKEDELAVKSGKVLGLLSNEVM